MTKRTTKQRLESYQQKVDAEKHHESWYSNPRELPLPTLPDNSYLEDEYLKEIEKSAPGLLAYIQRLIRTVKGVREGNIQYHGRKEGEPRSGYKPTPDVSNDDPEYQ